ncbi:MAG: hypothetical protein ACUVV3_10745 [Dehalococcoidia bacterium]
MWFYLQPLIGSILVFADGERYVEGTLVALTTKELVIQPSEGEPRSFPYEALVARRHDFPTFEDTLRHISDSGGNRHCGLCYIAVLYAVDLLAKPLTPKPFATRTDLIRRGLVSFLAQDFPSAAYSLLPQADGITTEILHEDGLLKATPGFPTWTKEHPNPDLHAKPCRSLLEALEGAANAGDSSRIGHVLGWLRDDTAVALRDLRNKLLHGTLLEVSEHEAATIVLLLQALHHGVQPHTQVL